MPPQPSALAVSLSRHQACRACRTRKIRCDAQRPACSPCVKWAVSRGRDPDSVICSYDGDVASNQDSDGDGGWGGVVTACDAQTTLVLGPDPTVFNHGTEVKNEMLEGRVVELEAILARQSATLAALLPSGADVTPSALGSLIGLPIASSIASSMSSPEAPGMDGSRPARASSVASSSGSSSMFTNEGPRRSSLDGAQFPPPLLRQLPPDMDPAHVAALGPVPIVYPALPTAFPPTLSGHAPLMVTTAVPLGPHSIACNDPNCPEYLRAREAAAMGLPQPLSYGAAAPAAPLYGGFPRTKLVPMPSFRNGSEPAMPNASSSLQNILADLGFATGLPGGNPAPQPPEPQIRIKMEEPEPFMSILEPPPAVPLPPMPAPMFPPLDPSWLSAALGGTPPPPPASNMDISPEMLSMLFPPSQHQHAVPASFQSMY